MSPEDAIAALPIVVGSLISVSILAVAFIWWLVARVENGCPACAHCQLRNSARSNSDEAARRATAERLFGVRRDDLDVADEVAPEEGPRSSEERRDGEDD